MTNRKRAWLHRLSTTTIVLALLSGCGEDEPEVISVAEDDPVIMVHDGQNLAIADTTTGGELQFDATTGCLYLYDQHATETTHTRVGPLWPPGTEPVLVDEKRGVDLPGAGVITEGDVISLHGAPDDPELYSEWADLFDRCWSPQTWVLVVGGPGQGWHKLPATTRLSNRELPGV